MALSRKQLRYVTLTAWQLKVGTSSDGRLSRESWNPKIQAALDSTQALSTAQARWWAAATAAVGVDGSSGGGDVQRNGTTS